MADRLKVRVEVEGSQAKAALSEIQKHISSLGSDKLQQAAGWMDKFTGSSMGASSALRSLVGGINPVVAGITAGAAAVASFAAAGVALVYSLGGAADQMANMAVRTGLSVNQIDQLQAMAKLADVNIGSLEAAARTLADRLTAAGGETDRARAKIEDYGISLTDATGNQREMGQVLIEVLRRLGEVKDQTKMVAEGTVILGRGATELLPLARNFKELEAEAKRLGFGMDEYLLARFGKASDEIDKIGMRWELLKRKLADPITAVINVAGGFIDFLNFIEKTTNVIDAYNSAMADAEKTRAAQANTDSPFKRQIDESIQRGKEMIEATKAFRATTKEGIQALYSEAKKAADEAWSNYTKSAGATGDVVRAKREEWEKLTATAASYKKQLDTIVKSEQASAKATSEAQQATADIQRRIADYNISRLTGADQLIAKNNQELGQYEKKHASQQSLNDLQAVHNREIDDYIRDLGEKVPTRMSTLIDQQVKYTSEWMKTRDAIMEAEQAASKLMIENSRRWLSESAMLGTEVLRDYDIGQIEREEAVGNLTIAHQIELNKRRLEVEREYQNTILEIQKVILESRFKQEEDEIRKKNALLQNISEEERSRRLRQDLANLKDQKGTEERVLNLRHRQGVDRAETQEITSRYRLIYDANKRLFDQIKQSSSSILDQLLTKSQSIWQAMANSFKSIFLTVFKEIVSSQVARALTSLVTGQSVGLQPSTVYPSGIGRVMAGLGFGSMPVFGGGGGVSYPGAPGGTPGFAGPVGSGPGAGSGGGMGGFGGFANMAGGAKDYLTQLGNIGGPQRYAMDAAGNMTKLSKGVGGTGGGALLAGGGMLVMDGLRRGGWAGVGETTAGGAMIGFKYGGPIGGVIGAVAGFAAGMIRRLWKSPEEQVKAEVQKVYKITIKEKGILKQIVDISKANFGGDIRLAVASPQVRELVELYAQTTGKNMAFAPQMRSVTLGMSGGQFTEMAQFRANGDRMSFQTSLGSGSLDRIGSGTASNGPMNVTIKLDGQATTDLMEGKAVDAIVNNPRAVQAASSTAMRASMGRTRTAALTLAPGQLTA
jgi:hypothetical protein